MKLNLFFKICFIINTYYHIIRLLTSQPALSVTEGFCFVFFELLLLQLKQYNIAHTESEQKCKKNKTSNMDRLTSAEFRTLQKA